MRRMPLPFLGFLAFMAACMNSGPAMETPEQAAQAFLNDLIQFDFESASTRAAPETRELLESLRSMLAVVPPQDLEKAREEAGAQTITLLRTEPVDDTKVTVVYRISETDSEERVDMVLVDGKWLAMVEKSSSSGEVVPDAGPLPDSSPGSQASRFLELSTLQIQENTGTEFLALFSRGTRKPSGQFDTGVTPLEVEYFGGAITQDPELMVTVPVFGMGADAHFGFLKHPLPSFLETFASSFFEVGFDELRGSLLYLWERGRAGTFLADVPMFLPGGRVRYLLDYQSPDGAFRNFELIGPIRTFRNGPENTSFVVIEQVREILGE